MSKKFVCQSAFAIACDVIKAELPVYGEIVLFIIHFLSNSLKSFLCNLALRTSIHFAKSSSNVKQICARVARILFVTPSNSMHTRSRLMNIYFYFLMEHSWDFFFLFSRWYFGWCESVIWFLFILSFPFLVKMVELMISFHRDNKIAEKFSYAFWCECK